MTGFKTLHGAAQMKALGARVARQFARAAKGKKGNAAAVFALVGDLGSGKTTFVQGFVGALNKRHRVVSPTFLIMRPYPVARRGKRNIRRIYHMDAYRIRRGAQLAPVGFYDALKEPDAVILVEWADRIKRHIPPHARWISFTHGETETVRRVALRRR